MTFASISGRWFFWGFAMINWLAGEASSRGKACIADSGARLRRTARMQKKRDLSR